MRAITVVTMCAAVGLAGCGGGGGSSEETAAVPPSPVEVEVAFAALEDREIEVGCGLCIYHMDAADGCITAALVEGTPMLVDGGDINAHSAGLCAGAARAIASGRVEDGRLVVTRLDLIEETPGAEAGDAGG
jgi:hypothetical protein